MDDFLYHVSRLHSEIFRQQELGVRQSLAQQISEIKYYLDRLERFKTFAENRVSREVHEHFARDLRDVCYMFENLLESVIINNGGEADQQYSPEIHAACIPISFVRRWSPPSEEEKRFSEIAIAIKQIVLKWERLGYNRNALLAEDLQQVSSPYESCEFFGREEEVVNLINYVRVYHGCQVIIITGMRGVGKTMVAQQVFGDIDVTYEYPFRVWVHVPQMFQTKKVLEEITKQIRKIRHTKGYADEDGFESTAATASRIWSYLENKKVLIVLDGISSADDWQSLKDILPEHSKIIITTRRMEVAASERSNHAAISVHLTGLTEDDVYQLLLKKAPETSSNTMLKELGKKIVNICGSVPYTIFRFLRYMETKHTVEEWKDMVNEALSSGLSNKQESQEVRKMLEFVAPAYYDLSDKIKPLFLYMGVLQQDLVVEVEKLYLLSLADGTLKPFQVEGERLLDVAERYVAEVAERVMVDLEEGDEPGINKYKYCKLRGLMRDLSSLKIKDEGFIKVLDFSGGNQDIRDLSSTSSQFRTFRAAINLDHYDEGCGFCLEDEDMMHVRVLLFSAQKKQVWPREFSSLLLKAKYLRVLDFNGIDFKQKKLPKCIKRAVHLRYLSFKDCILLKLPSWVASLKLLCVLDLRVQHSTKMMIPNILWKVKKLSHLYFPVLFNTADASRLSLHDLIELETIMNFNAGMISVEDLSGMPKLQCLHSIVDGKLEEIECIINGMPSNSNVGDLLRTSLDIKNFDCHTEKRHSAFRRILAFPSLTILHMEGRIRRMPMHHTFSKNLTKIVFIGSEMIEDPMKILEKLPKLQILVLDDAFVGEKIVCSAFGFDELKHMELLNLQNLRWWIVEHEAMQKLSTLAIANCRGLQDLPDGLEQCRGLREIKVSRMPKDFGRRFDEPLMRRI